MDAANMVGAATDLAGAASGLPHMYVVEGAPHTWFGGQGFPTS